MKGAVAGIIFLFGAYQIILGLYMLFGLGAAYIGGGCFCIAVSYALMESDS
jgi:hypothetical protein